MAARDRYDYAVTCPSCGESGRVFVSEDDYPFMKSLNKEIEKIEGKFIAKQIDANTIKITCSVCGSLADSH
jgi:C4-type Zn-finger protein